MLVMSWPTLNLDLTPSDRLAYAVRSTFARGLNLGAGSQLVASDDNLIVDNHCQFQSPTNDYDLIFDVTEPWPVAPGTYDIIWAFHILEHIPLKKVVPVLQEAAKALNDAGLLIIEVPDAKGITQEYANGNYGMMENIMGEDHYPGNAHRWHYCGPDLVCLLHVAGFDRTYVRPAKSYHAMQQPCIRVEAMSYGKHWSEA